MTLATVLLAVVLAATIVAVVSVHFAVGHAHRRIDGHADALLEHDRRPHGCSCPHQPRA